MCATFKQEQDQGRGIEYVYMAHEAPNLLPFAQGHGNLLNLHHADPQGQGDTKTMNWP